VDRFEYLSYVFEQLPTATTVEALEALLPWNVKHVLEERRKRREAALRSAADICPTSRLPQPCTKSQLLELERTTAIRF